MISRAGLLLGIIVSLQIAGSASASSLKGPSITEIPVEEITELKEVKELIPGAVTAKKPTAGKKRTTAARTIRKKRSTADWIGRFHPLLVHFPIAWLILLLMVEMAGWIGGNAAWRNWGGLLGGLTFLSYIPAGIAGFMRASQLGQIQSSMPLMESHRNYALISAGLLLVAMVLRQLWNKRPDGYRRWSSPALLIAATVFIALAGHKGGQMVFGINYLPF